MPFILKRRTRVRRDLSTVFPFFADAANLQRLTPPELFFRIKTQLPVEMKKGAVIEYTIRLYGIPMKWKTLITEWNPPYSFEDTQISGPYKKWVHTHSFEQKGHTTIIHDRVVYELPFGLLGKLVHPLVKRQLKRIFSFRRHQIELIFAPRHELTRGLKSPQAAENDPMLYLHRSDPAPHRRPKSAMQTPPEQTRNRA